MKSAPICGSFLIFMHDISATDSVWLFLILAFLMTGAMLFVGVKVMEFLDKRQNRK